MSNRKYLKLFQKAEIRLERLSSLAFQGDIQSLSDDAEILCDDPGRLKRELGINVSLKDEVCDIAKFLVNEGRLGIFAEFAQPIMEKVQGSSALNYSWGHIRLRWFYGETLEDVCTQALAWAEENRQKALRGTK